MRVLHVLNTLCPSGAETMLRAAAGRWREQGIEGEIVSTGAETGPYAEELRAAGYRIHHLPFAKSARFLWAFYRLVREGGYEAVHLHTERATFWYAALAWAGGQRRLVRTIHGAFGFAGPLRVRRGVQRWVMRRVFGVRMAACSESVAALEWERFRNPVTVPGNWFDSARYVRREERAAKEGGRQVILTVGNCAAVKNHEAVIRALAGLPEVEYVHAGCEEEGREERALAEVLGVADRVRFLGMVKDLRAVFEEADLLVMPSLQEGLGVAAIEAMGAGVPVLLADVKGLRDFRRLSGAVRYCAPDAEGVARGVRDFLALPAGERAAIGAELSEMAHRQFGVGAGAGRYAALYRGEMPAGVGREVAA
jgi:glycosyltransferase involved in cell wall biosynthesis